MVVDTEGSQAEAVLPEQSIPFEFSAGSCNNLGFVDPTL
jgi:hypothetical protein